MELEFELGFGLESAFDSEAPKQRRSEAMIAGLTAICVAAIIMDGRVRHNGTAKSRISSAWSWAVGLSEGGTERGTDVIK